MQSVCENGENEDGHWAWKGEGMENWAGPNLSPGLKGRTRGSDGVIAWNDFFFHLKEHVAKRRSWGIHITAKPT